MRPLIDGLLRNLIFTNVRPAGQYPLFSNLIIVQYYSKRNVNQTDRLGKCKSENRAASVLLCGSLWYREFSANSRYCVASEIRTQRSIIIAFEKKKRNWAVLGVLSYLFFLIV